MWAGGGGFRPWDDLFSALFSSRRLDRILALIVIGVILNFLAFFVISLSIGGDALNGKVVDGHYFLGPRLKEVSPALFAYSRWHAQSLIYTMPAAMLLFFVLGERRDARRENPFELTSESFRVLSDNQSDDYTQNSESASLLPVRIILHSDDLLTVHLRDSDVGPTLRSEAILGVNQAGRWIRGIKLVGGIDFNLARAVKPFKPTRPAMGRSSDVTYDEGANAAFIYFSMKPSEPESPETTLKYSHSFTPKVEFAFDSEGGLVWLRFSPRGENKSAADFVSLIDAPIVRQLA